MRIAFMGTPDFSVKVLEALTASREHEVGLVATQPDKAKNRGKKVQFTPVKELAVSKGIPVLQPERVRGNEEFFNELKNYAPDVIVVVAYGQILPKSILELPKYGCLNIHASLLPRLRGAAPIQHAIIDGEKETGVTIMQMGEGLDTGDMLLKDSIEIGHMNYEELHDALAEMGSRLILDALRKIEEGTIVPEKQDDSLSNYAHMISKSDGKIDFSGSAEEIERLIRGFDPWPGAFCDYKEENKDAVTIKFWKAKVLGAEEVSEIPSYNDRVPGEIVSVNNNGIIVKCQKDALLVSEIQVPGKKRVTVGDYLRGNKLSEGVVLC